nr:1-acyl-sn-glycerol-3-phosphate acyltransferase-like [Ipomoea batatas]
MWILGNPIKIENAEYCKERAIYVCNHASPINIFLIMWLTPTGTVGIAKKEIIFYPLFGQLYVLANHLRINRSNPTAAIESMKKRVQDHRMDAYCHSKRQARFFNSSYFNTKSKNMLNRRICGWVAGICALGIGNTSPNSSNHLHRDSPGMEERQLAIVPIIFTGTHLAWRKGSLHVRPAPLTVKLLPPISTDDWTADKTGDYVRLVHDVYVKNLPHSQKPLVE